MPATGKRSIMRDYDAEEDEEEVKEEIITDDYDEGIGGEGGEGGDEDMLSYGIQPKKKNKKFHEIVMNVIRARRKKKSQEEKKVDLVDSYGEVRYAQGDSQDADVAAWITKDPSYEESFYWKGATSITSDEANKMLDDYA